MRSSTHGGQLPACPSAGWLTISSLAGSTGLPLTGEADLVTVPVSRRAIADLPPSAGEIHLQLAGPEFIDVAATRLLVGLADRPGQPDVILHYPPPCLIRIIRLLCPAALKRFSIARGGRHPPPRAGQLGFRPRNRTEGTTMGEVFETTDLKFAEQILSSSYASLKIDRDGERGGMRLAQTALTPSVRFDHNSFTMSFDTRGTPLGVLVIGQLRAGRLTHRSGGSERSYLPGDVYLAVQPGHPYSARSADTDTELAVIDPALLADLTVAAPDQAEQGVRFTGYHPVSPQAARQWRATYAYVRDMVLTRPDAVGQALVAASAARLLVASALATFPNTALTEPTIEDRRDGSTATLRRAVAFIDEHAHQGITAADIAAAAHVTTRAVQLAFQRHLGISPMEYLRQVRLARARQDLIAADPAIQTVTAIAYRWGFTSSSRFAAQYLRAYGVTPSHTLRRD